MHRAGAGVIGEYDSCAFRSRGTGSFRGSDASNPTIGTAGSHGMKCWPSAMWLAPPRQAAAGSCICKAAHKCIDFVMESSGQLETVEELRVELVVPPARLGAVAAALRVRS